VHVVSHIVFSSDERSTVAEANRSIGIAFPEKPQAERTGRDDPTRVLGGLVAGAPASRGQLVHARLVLTLQLAVCRQQSAPAYWEPHIRAVSPASADVVNARPGAVPLVAEPERARNAISGARELQAEEALAALTVVVKALSLLPASTDDEE
jgi:hypothetical protein